jgi:hypothetical protein
MTMIIIIALPNFSRSNPLFCYSLYGLYHILSLYTVERYYRSVDRRLGCSVGAPNLRARVFILIIVSNAGLYLTHADVLTYLTGNLRISTCTVILSIYAKNYTRLNAPHMCADAKLKPYFLLEGENQVTYTWN